MADVKWIKITTDMFDNQKIKYLRKMPDGDKIILIWIMLLTMAGRCNAGGMIFLTETIPYTPKMLADELMFEESTVILALETLSRLGMICDNLGFIEISNWNEYQNVDGLEKVREQTRNRVAKHRDRKRLEMSSTICQYCGREATGYDHILAISRGGSDDDNNKIPCCVECNRIKNDKPLVDFLNSNRERINDEIIRRNDTLKRYVTLSNVTGRYEVTQRNAIEEELEREEEVDINNNLDINNNIYINTYGQPDGRPSDKKSKPTEKTTEIPTENLESTEKPTEKSHERPSEYSSWNDRQKAEYDSSLPNSLKWDNYLLIYEKYPKKGKRQDGFTNYLKWMQPSGKKVNGKTYHLSNRQIYGAVCNYVRAQESKGTELTYYSNFDTLMNHIHNYLDGED